MSSRNASTRSSRPNPGTSQGKSRGPLSASCSLAIRNPRMLLVHVVPCPVPCMSPHDCSTSRLFVFYFMLGWLRCGTVGVTIFGGLTVSRMVRCQTKLIFDRSTGRETAFTESFRPSPRGYSRLLLTSRSGSHHDLGLCAACCRPSPSTARLCCGARRTATAAGCSRRSPGCSRAAGRGARRWLRASLLACCTERRADAPAAAGRASAAICTSRASASVSLQPSSPPGLHRAKAILVLGYGALQGRRQGDQRHAAHVVIAGLYGPPAGPSKSPTASISSRAVRRPRASPARPWPW